MNKIDFFTPIQYDGQEKSIKHPSVVLLNNGVTLTESTVQKVQSVMSSVFKMEENNGVKLYSSQPTHRIFSINSEPNLIFKYVQENEVEERYNRMVIAKTVCKTHDLGLLVIPDASKFEVEHQGKKYTLIAEEKVEIKPEGSAQEQCYEDYADSLNETIRQLAVFICKTGFSDMEWRNAPVVENSLDGNGNRKIALIDLEEMSTAEKGLFGGARPPRRGLVNCVNEEQGKIVVKEAKKHLSWSSSLGEFAEFRQNVRKRELKDVALLRDFYSTHNIQNGDEQIVTKTKELDFSGYPKSEKLYKLAIGLIDEINQRTKGSSSEKSVKGRRYIYINTNITADTLFYTKDRMCPNRKLSWDYDTTEEYRNNTYLGIVVKKLVDLGHISKIIKRNGHGYFLQA